MENFVSPFHKIGVDFKEQPILSFEKNKSVSKKYLKEVQGKDIDQLFIGWICERDSFFAYLYKYMKRKARDDKSTKLAAEIACAGFPILLSKINSWVSNNTLSVLVVPVPSRCGVSERFTSELYGMLNKSSKKNSEVRKLINRLDNLVEVKKIDSWAKRNRITNNLFSLGKTLNLNQYAVLLVDDIITSGSSLRKCADLLKQSGVENIVAVSLTTNLFDSYSYKGK